MTGKSTLVSNDIQCPQLGKPCHGMQIFDMRMDFPVPVQSVVHSIILRSKVQSDFDCCLSIANFILT